MAGKVGEFLGAEEVEVVLPVATTQERRLRFGWQQRPSREFLMTWNQHMEPHSIFVNDVDEHGISVTVRWALMQESPENIKARLNRWLEQVETGTFRRSGIGGRHLLG